MPNSANTSTVQTNGSECLVREVDKINQVPHLVEEKQLSQENLVCRACKKSFNNLKVFKYHKQFLHMINKCRHCKKKFLNGVQLKLHTRFKHPDKYNDHILNYEQVFVEIRRLEHIDECFTCHIKFVDKESLLKHHATCDGKCIECGLKIPQKELYYKHLEAVHSLQINAKVCECPFCMVKYDSDKKLEEHIQRSHPEEMSVDDDSISETYASTSNDGFLFDCNLCSASFSALKSLNQHKAIKHRTGLKVAEEQESKTKSVPKFSRDEFMEKLMVKKSNDFYRCIPCGKEIFKRSLGLHLRSKHSSIRSFRCELCPEAYFRADYRQRHMASSHPKSFKCLTCDLQYDRAYKFDAHMQTMHDIPARHFKPEEGDDHYDIDLTTIKYIENSKNYDYTDDYMLLRPNTRAQSVVSSIATVIETPLSKDEFCEKYFIPKSDKVTFCNVCQQEIQKASVISHLLWKHAVQRPLKCAFCNERVIKNNARLSHMSRCHPNEYKCFDCNIQFVKHQQIVEHMFEVHKTKCNIAISSGEEEDLHTNEIRFVTNKNEDEIIDETEVFNPIVSVTEERKFVCAHCPKSFTSSKNLLIHKSHKHRNESSESLQNVSGAVGDSMSFDEFQNNWIEETNDIDAKCLVCDLTMKKKNLANHLKARHSTSGAYLCEICREAFYRPEQRSQHMNAQHRGMFYCDGCNIQFYRNSRYVKHMKDLHEIELMDSKDRFEVDLGVGDLRFVPTVRKNNCDDQNAMLSMMYNECSASNENVDPIEEMFSIFNNEDLLYPNTSSSEVYDRGDFMTKYFKNTSKDTKHCSACNKSFQASSLYHHLIHFHASILPFKCSFCDLRLERSSVRSRHMQVFHPNEVISS